MPGPRGGEIVVGLGDCRIASVPECALSTYALGSCLAVIVYDWRLRTGGLLHVMLPDSAIDRARAENNPWMYVDTGVPLLFRGLEERGSSKNRVRCCIAGGASMTAGSAHFEIGKRNYVALKKALARVGVFADREDVGGTESRSVRLDLHTGQIELKRGSERERVFVPPRVDLRMRVSPRPGNNR